ncbi:ATP-binding cassette sub- D member 4, partial [Coemansia aciculifera]
MLTTNTAFQPLMSEEDTAAKQPTAKQQYAVGLLMVRRLHRIFAVLLASQTPRYIGLGCGGLLAGKLASEIVFYYAGRLPSEFYKVLGDKDLAAFFPLLLRCMVVVAAAGTFRAALDYAAAALGVMMRSALATHTHKRYISANVFYNTVSRGAVDNLDQRITQDVERLSSSIATVLPELLVAPFMIAYYTVRCWSMAGPLGPLSIYVYFVIGALSTRAIMPPIIRNVYHQEREEGNLRFQEVRITEFAESIAFFAGEDRERIATDEALARVIGVQHTLLCRRFWLGLITQVFSYLGATVSY